MKREQCTVTGDYWSWTVTQEVVCAEDDDEDRRKELVDGAIRHLARTYPGSKNFRAGDWQPVDWPEQKTKRKTDQPARRADEEQDDHGEPGTD
jgi:hypothetical protein